MPCKVVIILSLIYFHTFFQNSKCNNFVDIDEDHLNAEKDCGKLPIPSSARIANAKESLIHYPWVIGVFRENTYYEGECGGSIITMTAAVTAAHCICKSNVVDTSDPLILSKLQCIGGKGKVIDPNNLPNEITNDNHIKAAAGSMDYRSPKKIFQIEYACVYDEFDQDDKWGEYTDLGLLKTSLDPTNGASFYSKNELRNYIIHHWAFFFLPSKVF